MVKYKIKKYTEGTQVSVTFTDEDTGIVHERTVNAVFTEGEYDKAGTIARVEEVARGVSQKIAAGVIVDQEPVVNIDPTSVTPSE